MVKKSSFVELNYIFLFFLFIVLLFLGVLYFLLALPRCSLPQPFMCFGHEIEGKTVHLYIKNNLAQNMQLKDVRLDGCNKTTNGVVGGGEVKGFTLSDCTFNFFYKDNIIVEYKIVGDSSIPHSQIGEISGAKSINL